MGTSQYCDTFICFQILSCISPIYGWGIIRYRTATHLQLGAGYANKQIKIPGTEIIETNRMIGVV